MILFCGISDMILFDILFLDASFQETTSVVGMPMLVTETVLLFKQFPTTIFVLFFCHDFRFTFQLSFEPQTTLTFLVKQKRTVTKNAPGLASIFPKQK
jgi:hypothetical protein